MSSVDLGVAHGLVEIDYNGEKLERGLKQLEALTDSNLVADQALSQVGNSLMSIGNIGKDALSAAIGSAADFEQQLSNLAAVGGKDAQAQMSAIRDTALQLGADTAFSTSEAAAGMTELVKAGLPIEDVLNGAAAASLDLAAATGVAVPDAASIMATTLNVFGDSMTGFATEGEKAVRIADLLAQTANASATDVGSIGEALKQVGNVAASFGVSIEETTQAIGLMADAGLNGSDAGTSLKTALLSLLDPTAKQSAAMSQLGLSYNDFYNADGSFKGMANLAETLQTSMEGLTDQQKQNALAVLFGADAYRAAKILAEAGAEGFAEMGDRQAAAGTVAEQAAIMMDNLNGSMQMMRGSVETLAIKIGSVFLPILTTLVDIGTMVVNAISALPAPVLAAAAAILGIGTAALLGVGGFMVLTNQIVAGITAFKALKPASDVASAALGAQAKGFQGLGMSIKGMMGSFGPLLIVLAVVAALIIAYKTNFLGFADAVNAVVAKVKEFGQVFAQAFASFQERGFSGPAAALAALGNAIGRVLGFGDLGSWFINAAYAVQAFGDRIKAFFDFWNHEWDIFSSSVSNGNPISDFFETLGYTLDHVFGIDVSGVFTGIANGINLVISTVGAIIQAFKDFRAQGLDPLDAAVAALSKVFAPIAGVFDYIGDAARLLVDGLKQVYDGFMNVINGIKSGNILQIFEGLAQIFSAGPIMFAKAFMNTADAILDVFVWLGKQIAIALFKLGFAIGQWIGGLALQAVDAIRNADWSAIPGQIAEAIGNALGSAGDFLRGVFDRLVAGAKNIAIDLGKIAVNIKDWLTGKIPDFMAWLTEKVTNLKNNALLLGDIAVSIGGWLIDTAKDFGAAIMDFIGDAAINIQNVATAIGGWIVSSVSDIWQVILSWIGDAGIAIQSVAAKIQAWLPSAITDFATAILNFIGDTAIDIASFAINIGSWVVTSALDGITVLKNFIFGDGVGDQMDLTTLTLNIGGVLLGTLTGLGQLALDLLGEVKTAIESALPDVDFAGIWSGITDTIGSIDLSPLLIPFEALGTALSTVYHTFSAIGQQIAEWIGSISDALAGVDWGGVFDGFATAVSTIWTSLSNLASNIATWIGDIKSALEEFGIPEPLLMFATVLQNAFSAISNLASGIGGFIASLTSGFDEAEKSAVWQGFKDTITSIGTIFTTLKDTLSSISGSIAGWIQVIIDALGKISIPNALKDLVDLLGKVKDFIFGGGDDAPKSADQVAQELNDQVATALEQDGNFGTNLVALLAEAVQTADWSPLTSAIRSKAQTALNEALSGSQGVVSPGLGGVAGGSQSGIGALIGSSLAGAVNGADWSPFQTSIESKLTVAFYEAWVTTVESTKELLDSANENVFAPFVEAMIAIITTGFTTLTTNITGKLNDLTTIIANDTSAIETQFDEMQTEIETSAADAMANLNTSFVDGMKEANATLSEAVTTMLESLTSLEDDAYEAGFQFANGYAEGIRSGKDLVTAAAAALGAEAISTIQRVQRQGSPSRVTMESGKYFAEGYAVGIANNIDLAKDAAKSLFASAFNQLAGTGQSQASDSRWRDLMGRVSDDLSQRSSTLNRMNDMTIEVNTVIDDREMGRYVIGKTIAPLATAAERVGNRRQRY